MDLVATITNEGEVHFLTYKESMTGALFVTFLEQLLSETTRKVFLILDRLPAHETKAVADWVAGHADRIELFWLPKYAPELNADEYLNNDLKGAINAEGLPGSTGGVAIADGAFHEQAATPPGTCTELLPTSLCPVCEWWLICEYFTCHGNTTGAPLFSRPIRERGEDLPHSCPLRRRAFAAAPVHARPNREPLQVISPIPSSPRAWSHTDQRVHGCSSRFSSRAGKVKRALQEILAQLARNGNWFIEPVEAWLSGTAYHVPGSSGLK